MKSKWQKIGSDYHSPFWRNWVWVYGMTRQPELVKISQVYLGIKGYGNKMDYLVKGDAWSKANKQLSKLVNQNLGLLDHILNQTMILGRKMNQFTAKLASNDLKKYSVAQIVKIYQQHAVYNSLEYAWGVLVPVLDFQQNKYVEDRLNKILKSKLSAFEAAKAFAVFTQPIEDSFAIEQEKSILRIYQKFPKNLLKLGNELILPKLKKNYPVVYRQLLAHEQKYAWVFYVYAGPAASPKDFLETLKFYHKKKINALKKLSQLNQERNNLLRQRAKYLARLKLNSEDRKFVEMVSKFVYLKPRRKDLQSKSYYHLEFLQREIGRRLGLSLAQVRTMTLAEIKSGLAAGRINVSKINERINFHIIIPVGSPRLGEAGKKVVFYQGAAAKRFAKQNIQEEKIKIEKVKEFFGQTGCPGKATGIVKRVDMPEDMGKMNQGDVLVSTATTPSIVPAIRKAAAIITDEGGLTCHAAIISREFNIPCVIGTGIATKVLKDGDQVEVDANKGVVKKL